MCFMPERLCEQRWPISAVLSDPNVTKKHDYKTLDLTTDQWATAEEPITILKPFITLTEFLSREENLSLSEVVPTLRNVKKNRHLQVREDDGNATTHCKVNWRKLKGGGE